MLPVNNRGTVVCTACNADACMRAQCLIGFQLVLLLTHFYLYASNVVRCTLELDFILLARAVRTLKS